MRIRQIAACLGLATMMVTGATGNASAVEESLGLYILDSGAAGAGQTPPAGVYFTTALSYAQFAAFGSIPFGGTTIRANVNLPALAGNVLVVLPNEILGGHLSVSATGGGAYIQFKAGVVGGLNGQQSVEGFGATDSNLRVALAYLIHVHSSDSLAGMVQSTENVY